jgi:outer membrane receptor protein involved in Fe transport
MKNVAKFLDDRLSMQLMTQFNLHDLDPYDSDNIFLQNYQLGNLRVADLLAGTAPVWSNQYNYRSNSRLRSELTLVYQPSDRFNVVGGAEVRYSSVGAATITSSTPPADETGTEPTGIQGGNQISSRDIGAYLQASWHWKPGVKLVGGGRLDNNKIRQNGGYGTVFNPRLAAVVTRKQTVFKAMYAQAFQDAPNFQKYQTVPGIRELTNPGLQPETVKNLEFSAAWEPRRDVSLSIAAYHALYDGIVQQVSGVPCPEIPGCVTTGQFQNVGRLQIEGLQAEAHWNPGAIHLQGNYTFAHPRDPDADLREGDIASHRVNVIGGTRLLRDRLDAELRINGVFGRKTGAGTTVSTNPLTEIDNYVIVSPALTYRRLFRGADLQFSVENLFNTQYYEPSLRSPTGFPIAAQVPQPGATAYVRLRVTR